jgi:hypothetical protein
MGLSFACRPRQLQQADSTFLHSLYLLIPPQRLSASARVLPSGSGEPRLVPMGFRTPPGYRPIEEPFGLTGVGSAVDSVLNQGSLPCVARILSELDRVWIVHR